MKIMDGSLTETKYSWPSEKKKRPMNVTDVTAYEKDHVAYINDSIGLHRVENRSHTNKAVSLHLYSPPFNMCQSFDERSGHKVKCNVTFHTKYGEKVCYRKQQ
uniref:Cysteine dioxygenase n=1 Tax=Phallusia mammillata TaxID=59560 RepID=A0A6F9D8D6_9ASCI|nr:cysteine dioxygenase type 1-like [Phallusia mammillata]